MGEMCIRDSTYVDTMSKGIRYNKQDVVIEFFKDAGCTDKITTWAEDSGKDVYKRQLQCS